MKPLDKKAVIFYFFMSLALIDFGRQIRTISFNSYFNGYSNPVFSIEHVYNTGSAFGMFNNSTQFLSFFAFVISIIIFIIIYKFIKFSDKSLLLSLTLLNSGTIGNMIERIKFHHVIDYINLNFIHFPVFNIYDIMICLGITIYIFFALIDIKQLKKFLIKNKHEN